MSNPYVNNTVITEAFINVLPLAYDSGILAAIKYCVPVWDYRLDTDVNTGMTSAIAYSATIATTSANTYPIGEKIWRTSGSSDYSLSQKLIISVKLFVGFIDVE